MSRTLMLAASTTLALGWATHAGYLARRVCQARRDPLTQLPRRDAFTRAATRLLSRRRETAVLFCDLDGFKAINDTYGHEAGDIVLAVTGDRLRRALPDGALLGRLGGDEFVAAVPGFPVEPDAQQDALAELTSTVTTACVLPDVVLTPGVSVGAAPGPHTDLAAALKAADRAMYAAKAAGGGATIYAPSQHGTGPVPTHPLRRTRHHGTTAAA